MFSAENIQARLHEQPFVPVRFVTSAGQTYDVFHPDLVLVGARFLIIGLPSSHNPTVADQVTRISMLHITEMKDLPRPAAPSQGNGPPQS